jgi:hypothetical protein
LIDISIRKIVLVIKRSLKKRENLSIKIISKYADCSGIKNIGMVVIKATIKAANATMVYATCFLDLDIKLRIIKPIILNVSIISGITNFEEKIMCLRIVSFIYSP